MRIGVAGLGFMGATHLSAWKKIEGAQVAAVMSSDEKKLSGDLTAISGNLGNSGERLDFSQVRKYRKFEDLLEDGEIEAIDICLPTDLHAPSAIAALRAGKHVLVEKPVALSGDQGRGVLAAASEAGKILMTGQVLRFHAAYSLLAEQVRSGGRVHSAIFRRRCAAPAWSKWLSDPERSGGGVFDLLIHDVDYCISVWGMPDAVRAGGAEDLSQGVDLLHAELIYPHTGQIIITGGWHHPKSYPFSMDFTVVTAGATFEWLFGAAAMHEYRADGTSTALELGDTDLFAAELKYFADCVRHNRQPDRCPPEQSVEAVDLMEMMLESRKRGGEVVRCVR